MAKTDLTDFTLDFTAAATMTESTGFGRSALLPFDGLVRGRLVDFSIRKNEDKGVVYASCTFAIAEDLEGVAGIVRKNYVPMSGMKDDKPLATRGDGIFRMLLSSGVYSLEDLKSEGANGAQGSVSELLGQIRDEGLICHLDVSAESDDRGNMRSEVRFFSNKESFEKADKAGTARQPHQNQASAPASGLSSAATGSTEVEDLFKGD